MDKLVLLLCCVVLCSGTPLAPDEALDIAPRLVPVDCVVPGCVTELDRATLWPVEDPNFYMRCEPNGVPWELVRLPCHGRRLFHFPRQVCTLPVDWEEPCTELAEPGPLPPCPVARCLSTADLRRLWPDEDPTQLQQCIPLATGGVLPVTQHCPCGTRFSIRYEACISLHRWHPECTFDGENTPNPTPGDTDPTTTDTTATQPPPTGTTDSGWTLCQMPDCEPEDPVLYPHTDRTLYWQCVPQPTGFWLAQARPCAAGTLFHFGLQQCVFPADWENFCPV